VDGLIRLGVEMGREVAADAAPAFLDTHIGLKQASEVQPIAQQGQDQQLA
jgi:hypothetical protein